MCPVDQLLGGRYTEKRGQFVDDYDRRPAVTATSELQRYRDAAAKAKANGLNPLQIGIFDEAAEDISGDTVFFSYDLEKQDKMANRVEGGSSSAAANYAAEVAGQAAQMRPKSGKPRPGTASRRSSNKDIAKEKRNEIADLHKASKAEEKRKQQAAQFPTAKGLNTRPKSAFRVN